jgi:hypothetical protein
MREQLFWSLAFILSLLVYAAKMPVGLKLAWAYFILNSFIVSYWPNYVPSYSNDLSNAIAWSATKYLFQLIMIPVFVLYLLKEKMETPIDIVVRAMILLEACFLISGERGMLMANTYGAGVIACFIPMWFRKRNWDYVGLLLTSLAVIRTHSRTGFLAAGVIGLTYGMSYLYRNRSRMVFITYCGIIGPCLLIGAGLYFNTFMHDPRALMWSHYMDWWIAYASPRFGAGAGSFEWVGLFVDSGWSDMRFYVLHNDWLQVLFEFGTVGLIAVIYVFTWVAWNLRRRTPVLAVWLAFGATALFYYPFHAVIVQLFAAIITTEAIKENEKWNKSTSIQRYQENSNEPLHA